MRDLRLEILSKKKKKKNGDSRESLVMGFDAICVGMHIDTVFHL